MIVLVAAFPVVGFVIARLLILIFIEFLNIHVFDNNCFGRKYF